MPKIAIIATAISSKSGGSYTLAREILTSLGTKQQNNNSNSYVVIGHPDLAPFCNSANIEFFPYSTHNKWLKRIIWDLFGFAFKFRKLRKEKDLIIFTLQNTLPLWPWKAVHKIIYLIQSIAFAHYPAPLFSRLFLYRHFYKFFIKLGINNKTYFIIQSDWLRKEVSNSLRLPSNKILTMAPIIAPEDNFKHSNVYKKGDGKFNFFYPALFYGHKNHPLIFKALSNLKDQNLTSNISFTLTIDPSSSLINDLKAYSLEQNVDFVGLLTKEKVAQTYNTTSALIFPSLIESYPFPLQEAAIRNLPILVSDLPYSRDCLKNYPNVLYFDPNDSTSLAETIKIFITNYHHQRSDFVPEHGKTWLELLKWIESITPPPECR